MKKIVFSCCATALLVVATTVSVNFAFHGKNAKTSYLALANIEALASGESGSSYKCSSGGEGSSACSTSVGGSAGGGGLSASCSVECDDGYHSCCNAMENKCQCVKD